jgi:hypothetical protein
VEPEFAVISSYQDYAPELLEALEALLQDYLHVKRFAHDNGLQWVGSSQAPDWTASQVIAKARGA